MSRHKIFCESDISIGLVNYKTFEMTFTALDLIRKSVDVSKVPVWVVDNDSNDASLAHLKTLDWIRLIERKPPAQETGFMAHGCALDMILERVTTKYLLILHTDTFIYDPAILHILLDKIMADDRVAAVGCMEPVWRSLPHTLLRYVSRGTKYYFRKTKIAFGITSRRPKLHYETHLKSFCALWNTDILRQHELTFMMDNRVPGYEMQDRLSRLGYELVAIPSRVMFAYLDHVDKGTASAKDGVRINIRRFGKFQEKLNKAKSS
jgi:GT2 family glycosyltransferase